MRTLATAFTCLFLLALSAFPQSTARIVGTVRDSSGAAVPDATVSAVNTQTSLRETRQTAADGTFSIPLLPVGRYEVEISKQGFQKVVRSGIILAVNDNATVDVSLNVGAVSES
ncbi:MAG: carboxypeptidase regulatory-like domain-containing protein, partial [Bryobacterales bacterium]|nr:carboxypeptidase regulatory-like domain-containing protein [Bryobacterales bacterium]